MLHCWPLLVLKSVIYLDNALNHFAVVFYCYINVIYVAKMTEHDLHILVFDSTSYDS